MNPGYAMLAYPPWAPASDLVVAVSRGESTPTSRHRVRRHGPSACETAPTARTRRVPIDDGRRSASLAVLGVLLAARAVLLEAETVRIVAAVLLGDVVALLTHRAGHGDLGANV